MYIASKLLNVVTITDGYVFYSLDYSALIHDLYKVVDDAKNSNCCVKYCTLNKN